MSGRSSNFWICPWCNRDNLLHAVSLRYWFQEDPWKCSEALKLTPYTERAIDNGLFDKGKSGASTICGHLYEAHTYSMSKLFALLGKMLQNQDKLTPKIRCSFFKLWYQLISGTTFEGAWELCHHLFPNHARCEKKREQNKPTPSELWFESPRSAAAK